MSNQITGHVYQQIIEKVLQMSQTDFEENGVEHQTLQEMGQIWQQKLSALKIAQLPWDPQPEPPRQTPTIPSNVKQEDHIPVSAPGQEQLNFPNIKSEPRYDTPVSAYPPMPGATYSSGLDANRAQQRATALIAERFGQTGNANLPLQGMAQHGVQGQIPGQQQRMAVPGQQQQVPRPQIARNGYNNPQTDGADEHLEEWKAFLAARAANDAEGTSGRLAADRMMRAQIDALAMRMDSGLMVPLDEMPQGKRREAAIKVLGAQAAVRASEGVIGVYDGVEDDEEDVTDPEDAINSDLDDPEDDLDGDGDGDEGDIDTMVCTYDKVQRVKNKWKCTLKDGILTTNKKEYLFHKATGEFEW